jgi:hypothetical protein
MAWMKGYVGVIGLVATLRLLAYELDERSNSRNG